MLSQVIATEIFKISLNECVSYLKKKKSNIKDFNATDVNNAYLKAKNIEMVKTIWQIDRSVNLNEFYYPSKIRVENKKIPVESLESFPENAKVVIQGTAGQGKSILLRYLAGKELRSGKLIPLFIELRKISEKNDLKNLIVNAVKELGINIEAKDLEHIYSCNKFAILLDAFDEIPENQVKDTTSYIESISAQHYDQLIVITSRPEADIQKSTLFNVYKLETLKPSDFKPMLEKFFTDDKESISDIINSIHKNKTGVAGLITTPLLLTLLTITYKSFNRIPEQVHEFYDSLFSLLVNRHDATKPGFRREFKSKLNEKQLEDLFCAFSFQCMIKDHIVLNRTTALEITKAAKKITLLDDVDESNFISDCHKNTCLIVKEGVDYHFIHKSIREYHSAKFIKNNTIDLKQKFYSTCLNTRSNYIQELRFLSVIDTLPFTEHFLIPRYKFIFDKLNWDGNKINPNYSIHNIEAIKIEDNKVLFFNFGGFSELCDNYFDLNNTIIESIVSKLPTEFKIKSGMLTFLDIHKMNNILDHVYEKIEEWVVENLPVLDSAQELIARTKKNVNEINFFGI